MSNVNMGVGQAAPGWYDDGSGRQRWWDGSQWQQYAPESEHHSTGPMTASQVNVKREAVYTRQQKGHSLIKHLLLACIGIGLFTIPYYSISPNHYWHA